MKSSGKAAPPMAVVRYYARELKRHKVLFVTALVSTMLVQVAGVVSPLFLRDFFNILTAKSPTSDVMHELVSLVFIIGGISFLGWLARRGQALSAIFLESRAMSNLYLTAFDYLTGHSHQFFISQFGGTLTRRVTKYAGAFETLLDSLLNTFLPTFLFTLGAVGVLFMRNHTLGIALALWAIVFILFQVGVSLYRQPIRVERADKDSALTGTIADAITNNSTITLFSGREFEKKRAFGFIDAWRAITVRSWTIDDYIWGAQGLLMIIINVGLLYGALIYWQRGAITVGDFVLIETYLVGLFENLFGITRELRRVYDAFADAGEMVAIMETSHGIKDAQTASSLTVGDGAIAFRDVEFHFHETRSILKEFNLSIAAGEKVALVGPSGAGKSTITRLLLRLYDVTGGAIEIDGKNIAEVTQESLRNAISYVPQEPILFHRSLMENIRYGRRDASDEEVIEAARQAHCHEFIKDLKEGYDTFVGERGIRLSGGERQRIAIARAILKNAPILLLDEATSSLDSVSEGLIQDALTRTMQGKTSIVIAHRLSTIMKMDRIIVVDHGTIVQTGTHNQLLEEGGLYATLWSHQAGGFLPDE